MECPFLRAVESYEGAVDVYSPPEKDDGYAVVDNPTRAFEDSKKNIELVPGFHSGTYATGKPLFPVFRDTLKPRKNKSHRANGYSTYKSSYLPTGVVFTDRTTGNDVVGDYYGDTGSVWGEWFYDEEHASTHPGESGHTFVKITDSSKSPIPVPAGHYVSQTTGGIYRREYGLLVQVGQIRNSIYKEGDSFPTGYDPSRTFFVPGAMVAGGGGIEWYKQVSVDTKTDAQGRTLGKVNVDDIQLSTNEPDIEESVGRRSSVVAQMDSSPTARAHQVSAGSPDRPAATTSDGEEKKQSGTGGNVTRVEAPQRLILRARRVNSEQATRSRVVSSASYMPGGSDYTEDRQNKRTLESDQSAGLWVESQKIDGRGEFRAPGSCRR